MTPEGETWGKQAAAGACYLGAKFARAIGNFLCRVPSKSGVRHRPRAHEFPNGEKGSGPRSSWQDSLVNLLHDTPRGFCETAVTLCGLAFQASRRDRRPIFVPLGKGDYRGVCFKLTKKTPCRKKRGEAFSKLRFPWKRGTNVETPGKGGLATVLPRRGCPGPRLAWKRKEWDL